MPQAVQLYRVAERRLKALGKGKAGRLVLSLFFKALLGIQRIFHFETLDDAGLAILTGGRRVLGRNTLGELVRAAPVRGVLGFVRETSPKVQRAEEHVFSLDEHAIARFTRKFSIRKGFHTIRNKYMKVEKLFFPFDVVARNLLPPIVTRGNASLSSLTRKLLPSLRRRARGAPIRLILDAGAANNHDELLELVDHPRQVTLVRTPRRRSYRKTWAALPNNAWTRLEEPGPYNSAPPKVIHIAQTTMLVKGKSKTVPDVRTLVIREQRKRGKDRWHAIWVFGDNQTPAYDLVQQFRSRQHHEQAYRIMLHDAFVDTAPSGYNKKSANPDRPGFKQNALTLYSWLAALATNAVKDFSAALPPSFHRAHPRTLRRWFLNVPADIFLGHGTLIVLLRPRRLLHIWQLLVKQANRRRVHIPWMDNRRLILSLDHPDLRRKAADCSDPAPNAPGVWC